MRYLFTITNGELKPSTLFFRHAQTHQPVLPPVLNQVKSDSSLNKECSRNSPRRSQLESHVIKEHSAGDKDVELECHFCHDKFPDSQALARHKKSSHGTNKIPCPGTTSTLKVFYSVHWTCLATCDVQYFIAHDYKLAGCVKIVFDILPFLPNLFAVCGKQFKYKCAMRNHQKSVHGSLKLPCEVRFTVRYLNEVW